MENLEGVLLNYEKFLETRNLSLKTIKDYKQDIKDYLAFCSSRLAAKEGIWSEKNSFSSYLSHLSLRKYPKKPLKPSSISRKRAALIELSTFYESMTKIPIIENKKNLKSPKIGQTIPDYYKIREIEEILNCFNLEDPFELRDFCLIHFLFGTGLRASELLSLKVSQIRSTGEIMTVIGKGNRVRNVFLPSGLLPMFEKYKQTFKSWIDKTQAVFFSKKGQVLTYAGLYYIVSHLYKKKPELKQNKHLHPHGFRHSFATIMLSNGGDIRRIADLLGHSSLNTTQKYAHVDKELLKSTMLSYHPHFN